MAIIIFIAIIAVSTSLGFQAIHRLLPVVVSWKYAEMMADLHRKVGLIHCKLYGYEPPPSTHENYIKEMK